MPRRWTILAAFFVLGAYAVCAQAVLLREAQVLLFGSELAWGLVLAFWLGGVAIGAWAGRTMERGRRPWLALAAAGLAMPLILASEVVLLRLARQWLGVGPGEYVGLGQMAAVTALATVPVSFWIGLGFPAASVLVGRAAKDAADKARAIGWVYLAESAGSLVGGTLFSFVLVTRTSAFGLAAGGGVLLALAMVLVVRGLPGARPAMVLAVVFAVAGAVFLLAGGASRADRATVRKRWETFAQGHQLVASADSRYQNLAIGLREDQFSLYSSGVRAATWPDRWSAAIEANLMACQSPAPKRMLVLGGGITGLVQELLLWRPDRLDYVTLDPVEYRVVYERLDAGDRAAADAVHPWTHFADARRFVKQVLAHGAAPYDLVVLAAPEPASILDARLYTEEFFAELLGIMADDGVFGLALSGSVGNWGPAESRYVGSVVRPLERVFPQVILTYGTPTYCLAAKSKGVLDDTGKVLAARYKASGIRVPYFDGAWFEGGSDMLDPAKRRDQRERMSQYWPYFVNTDEQPAAAVYRMLLWYETTGAAHAGGGAPAERSAGLLGRLLGFRFEWAVWGAVGGTVLAAGFGAMRGRRGLHRAALLWSVGTTGFASMAVEIVLLYTFQTLYGYVYSMVGLVIGVFMFGLVIGSLAMNRRLRRTAGDPQRQPGLRTVLALDLVITVFAAALVLVLALLRGSLAGWPVQVTTFALVAAAGVLGGLIFPLAAAVWLDDRASTGRAASAVGAADNAGACVGALVTGLALVPVLGISGTCLVIAALKAMSALLVGAARA